MPEKYRWVPWRPRNFRTVPADLLEAARQSNKKAIYVGASRQLAKLDAFAHLAMPTAEGETAVTLPSVEMGIYSKRNLEGWEVVRKDLPMITKTYSWETPNFGDASTYGTHAHYQDREVYQREFYEPQGLKIEVTLLQAGANGGLYNARVSEPIEVASRGFESDLLFSVNLLQENWGTVGILPDDATPEDLIRTTALDWEIFPARDVEDFVRRATSADKSGNTAKEGIVRARVEMFKLLNPIDYLRGTGGFGSYIGARFSDNLVVFENVNYGNALYVLYDKWEEVSKRSRKELLAGTDARFDRFPHRGAWQESFHQHMLIKQGKYRR